MAFLSPRVSERRVGSTREIRDSCKCFSNIDCFNFTYGVCDYRAVIVVDKEYEPNILIVCDELFFILISLNPLSVGCVNSPKRQSDHLDDFRMLSLCGGKPAATSRR